MILKEINLIQYQLKQHKDKKRQRLWQDFEDSGEAATVQDIEKIFVCFCVCECTHTPFILWAVIIFGFVIYRGHFLP